MGDGGYESRRLGGLMRTLRRRDEPSVVSGSDNDTTMVVVNNPRLREEARGPVGAASVAAAGRGAGRHRSPPISVASTRMDEPASRVHLYRTGADGRPELPAAGTPAEPGTAPAGRTGPMAGRAAAPAGGIRGAAVRVSSTGAARPRGAAGGGAGAAAPPYDGPLAGPPEAQPEPVPVGVHHPPLRPSSRRAADRAARHAARPNDAGLYDAAATYRPAPEDDHQGYLRPVRPELDDDDLYRLFDPSRDRTSSGGSAWSR
jgi:hypothetical protein